MMTTPDLAGLRREIDRIDDRLHDLIMQRADVVQAIRACKRTTGPAIRPARQAQILRRLVERHKGPLPATTIIAIWREMLAGFTALQGDFTIVVSEGLTELAYAEYGDAASVTELADPIEAVTWHGASLAVLLWPGEQTTWWYDLARMADRPTIVAAIPFAPDWAKPPVALALAKLAFEPSGDDCSLIASAEAELPFTGTKTISRHEGLTLFLVPDYVAPGDARLDSRHILLGGYPRPLRLTNA